METVIQSEANPLYIVDPVYFSSTENANLTVLEGLAEGSRSREWLIRRDRRDRRDRRSIREKSPIGRM